MAKLPEAPEFKTSLKGYLREDVDRYIESIRAAAGAEIARLENNVTNAETLETAAIDRAYFYILDVRARLLADANLRARGVLLDATNRAAEIRNAAREGLAESADPEAMLAEARLRAEELLSTAAAEAERIQGEARDAVAAGIGGLSCLFRITRSVVMW